MCGLGQIWSHSTHNPLQSPVLIGVYRGAGVDWFLRLGGWPAGDRFPKTCAPTHSSPPLFTGSCLGKTVRQRCIGQPIRSGIVWNRIANWIQIPRRSQNPFVVIGCVWRRLMVYNVGFPGHVAGAQRPMPRVICHCEMVTWEAGTLGSTSSFHVCCTSPQPKKLWISWRRVHAEMQDTLTSKWPNSRLEALPLSSGVSRCVHLWLVVFFSAGAGLQVALCIAPAHS